jgi:hypothetical protein
LRRESLDQRGWVHCKIGSQDWRDTGLENDDVMNPLGRPRRLHRTDHYCEISLGPRHESDRSQIFLNESTFAPVENECPFDWDRRIISILKVFRGDGTEIRSKFKDLWNSAFQNTIRPVSAVPVGCNYMQQG